MNTKLAVLLGALGVALTISACSYSMASNYEPNTMTETHAANFEKSIIVEESCIFETEEEDETPAILTLTRKFTATITQPSNYFTYNLTISNFTYENITLIEKEIDTFTMYWATNSDEITFTVNNIPNTVYNGEILYLNYKIAPYVYLNQYGHITGMNLYTEFTNLNQDFDIETNNADNTAFMLNWQPQGYIGFEQIITDQDYYPDEQTINIQQIKQQAEQQGYIAGQEEIITNPNAFNLYTGEQLAAVAENANAEIIDLPGMMLHVLSMPWTFISNAFDLTIFEGTPYQINFANIFKGLIAILALMFIIKMFTNGFNALGNVASSAEDRKNKKADTNLKNSQAKLNDAKTSKIESKNNKEKK